MQTNNQKIELPNQENNLDDKPLDPNKIRIQTKCITIDLLLEKIRSNEIELTPPVFPEQTDAWDNEFNLITPDYHEQSEPWSDDTKSRLIESLLVRIPLPAFYIDTTNDKWTVIDGLQRIHTFKDFILDEELVLTDLQYLVDLNNKKYGDLSRDYQRRINETELTVHLIQPGTPVEVTHNIFQRINTRVITYFIA